MVSVILMSHISKSSTKSMTGVSKVKVWPFARVVFLSCDIASISAVINFEFEAIPKYV
jgi:hypothetical protein